MFNSKHKSTNVFVEPDEIFLDSRNLPGFDQQQFEGRLEQSISKRSLVVVLLFFCLVTFLFIGKLFSLQIHQGSFYTAQSDKNRLAREPIFADRGIIYDRNNVELAWNAKGEIDEPFAVRQYISSGGFAHILGYVSYPRKDNQGIFWQTEYVPRDGVEKTFDSTLKGKNGLRLIEKTTDGISVPSNVVVSPIPGQNLTLTIDSELQKIFYEKLKTVVNELGYQGGSALMMDVNTGEVLAMTSYPEYDPGLLSKGDDENLINQYISNPRKPFLNRAITGLYSPGSIIKPFIALGALEEGVVTPSTKILSRGSIKIPNPYHPGEFYTFKDLRPDNGWVDLPNALRVSSNIYFYNVSGGFGSQKGIGILNIEKYVRMFGIGEKSNIPLIGEKSGTIPNPNWKTKNFGDDPWRIGDTYNTSIGQYGFQVTPLQMLRGVAVLANRGTLFVPKIVKDELPTSSQKLVFPDSFYDPIHQGMRLVVLDGTGIILKSLPIEVSAKTGTAQVGRNNEYVNSWIIGFYPSDKPKYAFAVLMDRGAPTSLTGGQRVMEYVFDELINKKSPYVQY